MTDIELTLNQLAEVTTTAISKVKRPLGLNENINIAKQGGAVTKSTRNDIETRLGQNIISSINASDKMALEVKARLLDNNENE